MHLRIGYFIRTIAVLNRIGLALQPRVWLLKAAKELFPVAVTGGSSWLFKWLLKATEYLIVNSRSDADAQAALAIMKHVHGGGKGGGMYRDRIADQMCREADEELTYHSNVAPEPMSIIITTCRAAAASGSTCCQAGKSPSAGGFFSRERMNRSSGGGKAPWKTTTRPSTT